MKRIMIILTLFAFLPMMGALGAEPAQGSDKTKIGTVKWFNAAKGLGFISPEDGGRDVFVHLIALEQTDLSSLAPGQKVTYEVVNKPTAQNIHLIASPEGTEN